jgi:hypothetical protein
MNWQWPAPVSPELAQRQFEALKRSDGTMDDDLSAIFSGSDCAIRRVPKPRARFPLLEEMWVERGDRADWDLLHGLHYKMQSTPVGAKYWRVRFRGETIGVCVFGMSRPLLKERHAIFPRLTPGQDTQLTNIHRYRYINDNFRVIGRLVVDTMFRSAGVAYRFANLASRMTGFTYIEIQSSMSKYNLFAQRAGFTFVRPIRSPNYDKGLRFMRRFFAAHPGDQEALMEEFARFPPAMQKKVERELKAFYYDHSPLEKTGSRRFYSDRVVDNWGVRRTISKIQGLCFASPLYGLYKNPDAVGRAGASWGGDLPARLPLLAFDLQAPEQPLALARLDKVPGWGELQAALATHPEWGAPTRLPEGFLEAEDDGEELQDLQEVSHA